MSILPRSFVVVCVAAGLMAPAAFAHTLTKYGPDLSIVGQSQGVTKTTGVSLNLTLTPSYRVTKPGVVVTMRNCTGASLKLQRRLGRLGSGQTLRASGGKLVWTVKSVPGKPAKPTLNLLLAAPKGNTLCVSTSMYDNYTRKTVHLRNAIPL